ncbi:MAG TPA: hypothetical protein VGN99_03010 [Steroidobacteraceae bacterium]|nr:hypothetical protein [Steroidobacteraceae bacterium]
MRDALAKVSFNFGAPLCKIKAKFAADGIGPAYGRKARGAESNQYRCPHTVKPPFAGKRLVFGNSGKRCGFRNLGDREHVVAAVLKYEVC